MESGMNAGRTKYYTVNELADMLAIAPLTLRRLAASETIPAVRVGRVLRFNPADVDAYLARNRSGGQRDDYLKKGAGPSTGSAAARQGVKGKRPTGKAKAQGKGRGGQAGRPRRPAGEGR